MVNSLDRGQIVILTCALLVVLGLISGVAQLCGKWMPANTARVSEENMPAWRRWCAGFSFSLAALWGMLFAMRLVLYSGNTALENLVLHFVGVVIALGVVDAVVVMLVTKHYTGKIW